MSTSNISFHIQLDEKRIPTKIFWQAEEATNDAPIETNATSIAVWDHQQKNTLRIDLWTKKMSIQEMKKFTVDIIGGLAQSILTATGDDTMSQKMQDFCDQLAVHIKKNN